MTPRLRRLLALAVGGLALAAAYDGYLINAARLQNEVISTAGPISAAERRPYLVFAGAARAGTDGDYLRALTLYKQVANEAPPGLRIAARYNSANLHLREALRLRDSDNFSLMTQVLPLLELAKAGYREVLRDDPQHWDARYNLERALRLAPEGDEADEGTAPRPLEAERAATTMKGISLGLP